MPYTANPVADAEAYHDAAEARQQLLDSARQSWIYAATPDDIAQHANTFAWDQIAAIVIALANYQIDYAQATERATSVMEHLARCAVPRAPRAVLSAERLRVTCAAMDDLDVEQRR